MGHIATVFRSAAGLLYDPRHYFCGLDLTQNILIGEHRLAPASPFAYCLRILRIVNTPTNRSILRLDMPCTPY
jgi:hypothetical protein